VDNVHYALDGKPEEKVEETAEEKAIKDQKISELTEVFNELYDTTWKALMETEMYLHESIDTVNTNFQHVIQDMMGEFIEKCKAEFVQLREADNNFIEALVESVESFITEKSAKGREEEIPEELRDSLVDRNVIPDYSEGMRDLHMRMIDAREDRLIEQANEWVNQLRAKLKQ